ncbi:MAG: gamma-glutamyltransferase [Massilia sp.]|nr:gamma-glutamyltransferase [Massilia sp.]
MLNTTRSTRAMAVAPHHLASQSALAVMREGGNAIEAMIAAAATIAVVYPHMNGIGGDGFWLIVPPGGDPVAIDACGPAAQAASIDFYRQQGMKSIPIRGPLAANTVAGTVGGWQVAREVAAELGGAMPVARLLQDAIAYARGGVAVTASQQNATKSKWLQLRGQSGFAGQFTIDGALPLAGQRFIQPRIAATLQALVDDGLDSYYRGPLAGRIAADLAAAGSPVTLADLAGYRAQRVTPLHLAHSQGDVYNLTPPTQGAVSLAILGLLDRAGLDQVALDSADHVHLVVEATKLAFGLRDQFITDPAHMALAGQALLDGARLDDLAARIDPRTAAPWGAGKGPGDTIWMGVIDESGLAVSFIQSIYHEFGSGVVLGETGINWQNRGASFSLDGDAVLALKPGKKPFHTLNPAAARLHDGRVMVYGTMGGDGQPQTQAAVFTRHVVFGQPLQTAVTAPRWLLGRTWGQSSDSLKLEGRWPAEIVDELKQRGHEIDMLADFDETMGHAGAIVRNTDGVLEGAADPRSDGAVASW